MIVRLLEKLKYNILIVAAVLVVIFVGPNMLGYVAYSRAEAGPGYEDYEKSISELKSEILVYRANISACSGFSEKLFVAVENFSEKLSGCRVEAGVLKINVTYLENRLREKESIAEELSRKNEKIEEIVNENGQKLDEVRKQYELLAENSANNICCKARVDNPRIMFYKIENDRISCAEYGTLRLSCA